MTKFESHAAVTRCAFVARRLFEERRKFVKQLSLAAVLLAGSIQGVHADGLPWEFYLDSNQHMEVRITDQVALDGILRATWKAMRTALLNGDTQLAAREVS